MSVWAQAWAYEQRLGKWRKTKKGEDFWKGDSGAKSVLAAAATFADENGYCFVGQDTLASMCDMSDRTVREHLYNLEHAYEKIKRRHRRKNDGGYTSDGIWLLAPAHRLRPPRNGDEKHTRRPAAEFAVGEKRHQRQSLPPPAAEFAVGPAAEFAGEPSVEEPSVEPSVSPRGTSSEKPPSDSESNPPAKEMTTLTIDRCREVGFDPARHQIANWGRGWSKYLYVAPGHAPPEPEEAHAVLSEIVAAAAGNRGKGRYWVSVQDAVKRVEDDGTALGRALRESGIHDDSEEGRRLREERRRQGGAAIWIDPEGMKNPKEYYSGRI